MSNVKELTPEEEQFINEQLQAFGNNNNASTDFAAVDNDYEGELEERTAALNLEGIESDDDFEEDDAAANVGDTWVPDMNNAPIDLKEDDDFVEPTAKGYTFDVETVPADLGWRQRGKVRREFVKERSGEDGKLVRDTKRAYQRGGEVQKQKIQIQYTQALLNESDDLNILLRERPDDKDAIQTKEIRIKVLKQEWDFVRGKRSTFGDVVMNEPFVQSESKVGASSSKVEQTAHGEDEGVRALRKAYQTKQPVCINLKLGRTEYMKMFAQPSQKHAGEFVIGTVLNESSTKPMTITRVHTETGKLTPSKTWVPKMMESKAANKQTLEKAIRTACALTERAALSQK